jgi:hypothetical protein
MYTQQVAQLDNLVNQHTIRGTLGLLAELCAEKAKQCKQSSDCWLREAEEYSPAIDDLRLTDAKDGKQWVALGRHLIALARKFNQLQ